MLDVDLHYRIEYYKGIHRRAKERLNSERLAHKRRLACQNAQFDKRVSELRAALEQEHKEQIEVLKQDFAAREQAYQSKIVELTQELALYRDKAKGVNKGEGTDFSQKGQVKEKGKKKGGKKKGTQGGRQFPKGLLVNENELEPEEEKLVCPRCGRRARQNGIRHSSSCMHYEVKVTLKSTVRSVYEPDCECGFLPRLIEAPLPKRAFTRSMYSDEFWIEALVGKYGNQIPTHVFIEQLRDQGLGEVKAATLCNGIERGARFLQPLVDAIVARNKMSHLWGSDESSMPVFVVREGRETSNHYLWQYHAEDTVVFVLCPTRGGEHPREYWKDCKGIAVVDRAKAFQTATWIVLAFCWAHVRRDFIKIGRYAKGHRGWALGYLLRIRKIFKANRKRLACKRGSESFEACDKKLRQAVGELAKRWREELTNAKLAEVRRKPLESLDRHWEGLCVFVNNPDVPMDNNESERNFRDLARFRHNCNGAFSVKFGMIAAAMFTLFATLKKCGLPIRAYLKVYFNWVAECGGKPPGNLSGYLPWDLSDEIQKRIKSSPIACDDYLNDS